MKHNYGACELCDSYGSERREDDIHVCDECNEKYPIQSDGYRQ